MRALCSVSCRKISHMRAGRISGGFQTYGRVVSFGLAQPLADASEFRDGTRIRLSRRIRTQGHVSLRGAG
jgi:hypothetical protein